MVTTAGPVAPTQRSVAPDAARGLALLGIALANSVSHLSSGPTGPGLRPLEGSGLDHTVDALISLVVDRRGRPPVVCSCAAGSGSGCSGWPTSSCSSPGTSCCSTR